jgi:hypothetical protein
MNENNQLPDTFAADADTINAVIDAMGGLVMCMAKHMPPDVKAALASDLARLSANSTASGRPLVGRLMSDLSRAAAL